MEGVERGRYERSPTAYLTRCSQSQVSPKQPPGRRASETQAAAEPRASSKQPSNIGPSRSQSVVGLKGEFTVYDGVAVEDMRMRIASVTCWNIRVQSGSAVR
jgi:hypothetical protein